MESVVAIAKRLNATVATVALDLVQADVGDRLLVHLGFAIARLEPT